jgi:hypothetical protein
MKQMFVGVLVLAAIIAAYMTHGYWTPRVTSPGWHQSDR